MGDLTRSERLGLSIGDRVMILEPHPWRGHAGVVSEIADLPIAGFEESVAVDLDSGLRAGIVDPSEFEILERKPPTQRRYPFSLVDGKRHPDG